MSNQDQSSVFVYGDDNLQDYRAWLRCFREWARKTGGRLLEEHLLGEPVDEATVAAGIGDIGYTSSEATGVSGGNRRQVTNPKRWTSVPSRTICL